MIKKEQKWNWTGKQEKALKGAEEAVYKGTSISSTRFKIKK